MKTISLQTFEEVRYFLFHYKNSTISLHQEGSSISLKSTDSVSTCPRDLLAEKGFGQTLCDGINVTLFWKYVDNMDVVTGKPNV